MENKDKQTPNNNCGSCLWHVDGVCYFNHSFGEITNHKPDDSACKFYSVPNVLLSKSDIENTAKCFADLRERFGHDVRCKECFWFCSYKDDPDRGICGRTRFDIEQSAECYGCVHFEVDHD